MSDPSRRQLGDPHVAMLLTWFVPGAGHMYLGKVKTAAIAFGVIQGLYLLGYFLSEGLFLNVLPPEMRGRFAGVLSPEFGNLGALLLHLRATGFLSEPRPWPSQMDLGMVLTAASGVLNVILVAKANFDARTGHLERSSKVIDPGAAAALTWLVPGLGHWMQGRKNRGIAVFVMLVGLFVGACFLAEGANLDRERHFYYWAGQYLLGLPAIIAEFIHGHARVRGEIPYVDAGIVLGCVAGMLNVLVILDVFGWSENASTQEEPAKAEAPAETQEASA